MDSVRDVARFAVAKDRLCIVGSPQIVCQEPIHTVLRVRLECHHVAVLSGMEAGTTD